MLVLIFLTGMAIGSFLALAAWRIPRGESVIAPGSYCDVCGETLKPVHMIPVASYMLLRGRCAVCDTKISALSTLTEITFGVLLVVLYRQLGLTLDFIILTGITGLLFVMALIDLRSQEVYDRHLIMIGALILLFVARTPSHLLNALPGVLVWTVLALGLGHRMGDGDKILIGLMLFLFAPPMQICWLVFSIWCAAALGIVLLIRGASRKTAVPFVPFLTLGFCLLLLIYPGVLP